MIGIRDVSRGKFALKIESAQSGQSDIKHKATRRIWQRLAQKGIRRVKALNLQTNGAQEELQRGTYRWIIIDDKDYRRTSHERFPRVVGSVKENTAP